MLTDAKKKVYASTWYGSERNGLRKSSQPVHYSRRDEMENTCALCVNSLNGRKMCVALKPMAFRDYKRKGECGYDGCGCPFYKRRRERK